MNTFQIKDVLLAAFDNSYNKNDLASYCNKWVKKFVLANEDLCIEEGISTYEFGLASIKGNLPKMKLVELASIPYRSKKLFQAFRKQLPDEIKVLLEELIWRKMISHEETEKLFEITIYDTNESRVSSSYSYKRYEIKPLFKFFKWTSNSFYSYQNPNFTLRLPVELRAVIATYVDKPKDATFNSIEKIADTQHIYQGEQEMFLELARINAYKSQKQIKTTKNGRPQSGTIGKMQRKLNLKEFFPESEEKMLKHMRTQLLAGLIMQHSQRGNSVNETQRELRNLFETYRTNYSCKDGLISYLKGLGYIEDYYINKVENVFFSTFKNLPINKWISFSNFEAYLKYNFIDVKPMEEGTASDRLYYANPVKSERYSYVEKNYVSESNFYSTLQLPFTKGTCFLFAAFGLLDIAYDNPDLTQLGESTYSPYDELAYIKLNALGAFVLGKTNFYEAPESISKSTIQLSENSLTIVIDENDITAPVILDPYAQRVSPNRYQTDFSFFLKGISTSKALEDKISLFKNSIKIELPSNWKDFFNELRKKIDPLKKVSLVTVFHIPEDNPELLSLIAKDAVFRKVCLKAENHHIIVTRKNLPKFKQRLQEFGYMMTK